MSEDVLSSDAEDGRPLGRRATRGAATTMVAQAVKIGAHFAGLLVLARLLDPDDFGLLAMVVAITGVGEVVRDFGLSSAAVQARSLSDDQRTALFWINTGIGAALTLIVMGAANPIATLYSEPDLAAIARVVGLTFLINGMSTQFRADLNRDMRFVAYSVADVGGHVIGLVAAVVFAILGAGPWALVAQQLGQKGGVLLLSASLSRHLPGWPRRGVPVRPLLSFGSNLMGIQLLGYVSRNIDSLIIGNRFGSGPLGIYNRAFQLLMLPLNQLNSPATNVALPVLARLRDDRPRYDAFLLRGQAMMMHVVMAVFAFASAVAWPLIPLVLGDKWSDVVPVFRILAVGGVFHAAAYACYWVLLSEGLTRAGLRFQLLTRPIMVAAIVMAGFVSTEAVAAAYTAGLVVTWPWQLWWISQVSDAPARAMFVDGLRTMVAYGLAGSAAYGATLAAADLPEVGVVLISGLAMLAALGALVAVWPALRRDLVQVVATSSHLLPGRGGLRRGAEGR